MGFVMRLLGVFALLLVSTAAVIMSGIYDIGADSPHTGLVLQMIETFRDRSIEARAGKIQAPPLDDPVMIQEGARRYGEMCVVCHGAPAAKESELSKNLYPAPPDLSMVGIDDSAEAFWITKHGIKMTGMPAWGKTFSDGELWTIVAFLRKLPSLSAEQYKALMAPSSAL